MTKPMEYLQYNIDGPLPPTLIPLVIKLCWQSEAVSGMEIIVSFMISRAPVLSSPERTGVRGDSPRSLSLSVTPQTSVALLTRTPTLIEGGEISNIGLENISGDFCFSG